jgi:hypothetical protein
MSTRDLPGGKERLARWVRLTTLPPSVSRLSAECGIFIYGPKQILSATSLALLPISLNSILKGIYRRADNSRPVSFTVSAWEWVYATNLSRLQRETNKRHVGEVHSVLITGMLLLQRLSCYWGKIVSLRMLTNLQLASDNRATENHRPKSPVTYTFCNSNWLGSQSWGCKQCSRLTTMVIWDKCRIGLIR